MDNIYIFYRLEFRYNDKEDYDVYCENDSLDEIKRNRESVRNYVTKVNMRIIKVTEEVIND